MLRFMRKRAAEWFVNNDKDCSKVNAENAEMSLVIWEGYWCLGGLLFELHSRILDRNVRLEMIQFAMMSGLRAGLKDVIKLYANNSLLF